MRRSQNALPSAAYQTADEISELIRQREQAIELLPEGQVKQRVASDLARLRSYAAEWHNVTHETLQ